ncbi:MAG TPA: hypothetical protein VFY17_04715, partial [Pilimelia sp.]|nr:hypothetical protein [Pilimelia sp.]
MQQRVKVGELVPVEDRAQWVLATRLVFAALVALMWLSGLTGEVHGGTYPWVWGLLCWPLLTVTTLVAGRMGRRVVRSLLTATMLGDGVVLAFGWWATGDLSSPLSYLVILHGVAVTMLASFRTGVRIALWHSILALLVLEATALGHLGPAQAYSSDRLSLYLCAMWIAVLGTASFAAQNERELRRRRYDSE